MFTLPDKPVLAVAGLWREGGAGELETFAMLTTPPGRAVAPSNDRQIAVLASKDRADWHYLERRESEVLRQLAAGSLKVSLSRCGVDDPPQELLELTQGDHARLAAGP